MDALVFASTKNNITDFNTLDKLAKNLQSPELQKLEFGLKSQQDASLKRINDALQNTAWKRACCLQNPTIPVRIPLPIGEEIEKDSQVGKMYEVYKIYDKDVDLKLDQCPIYAPGYDPKTPGGILKCDDFFRLYCANEMDEFTKQNKGKFDSSDFIKYKPECSCMVPLPGWITESSTNLNIAPKCVLPGCPLAESNKVWFDSISRGPSVNCETTVCNANFSGADLKAGKDIQIQNKVEQNCGRSPFKEKPADITSNISSGQLPPTNPSKPTLSTPTGGNAFDVTGGTPAKSPVSTPVKSPISTPSSIRESPSDKQTPGKKVLPKESPATKRSTPTPNILSTLGPGGIGSIIYFICMVCLYSLITILGIGYYVMRKKK